MSRCDARLREQHRRQLAACGSGHRIGRPPGLEEFEQLLARSVVVPAAIAAHDGEDLFDSLLALTLGGKDLGKLQPGIEKGFLGGFATLLWRIGCG